MRIWQGEEGGWPYIQWVQEVPTGRSVYSDFQSSYMKVSVVLALFAASLIYFSGSSIWSAALAAIFTWSIALGGGKALQGMVLPWGMGRTPVFPEASEAERRRETIERATPIMTSQTVRATIVRSTNAKGQPIPLVTLLTTPQSGDPVTYKVPLTDIREFSLGTDDEWFEDIALRNVRSARQQAQSWVIVAPTTNGHGVLPVAQSGRDKGSMADLYGRLRDTFILNRPALLKQFEREESAFNLDQTS